MIIATTHSTSFCLAALQRTPDQCPNGGGGGGDACTRVGEGTWQVTFLNPRGLTTELPTSGDGVGRALRVQTRPPARVPWWDRLGIEPVATPTILCLWPLQRELALRHRPKWPLLQTVLGKEKNKSDSLRTALPSDSSSRQNQPNRGVPLQMAPGAHCTMLRHSRHVKRTAHNQLPAGFMGCSGGL